MIAAFIISLISFACGARVCFVTLKYLDRIRTRAEVDAIEREKRYEQGD